MVISVPASGYGHRTHVDSLRRWWRAWPPTAIIGCLPPACCRPFAWGTGDIYRTVVPDAGHALRDAAFQVVSIVTTTGYAIADCEMGPAMSQMINVLCMVLSALIILVVPAFWRK